MASKNFHMEIRGLDELISDFKKAGVNYEPLLAQAMVKSTERIKRDTQNNLRDKGISNTGTLRRSVQVREASARRGVVGIGERYGAYVEFGTRPHFPPVAPIERWAKTKLGQEGLGFVIARKIARRGTKAQPYVEPAFRDNAKYILDQFAFAINTLINMVGSKF